LDYRRRGALLPFLRPLIIPQGREEGASGVRKDTAERKAWSEVEE
jgi:hypothetical protein